MENDLLNIYGARISKSGEHINLTLVRGEGTEKEFYNCAIKIHSRESKIYADKSKQKMNGKDYVFIYIPILDDIKEKETPKEEITDDEIPF